MDWVREKTKMADGTQVVFESVLSSHQCQSRCEFCSQNISKYTCPRCNARYCSSTCYKSQKHRQCSELFYKECVITTLREQEAGSESKRKMLEMLRKLEEDDREGNGDFVTDDLEERLGEIDLNTTDAEVIWSAMTEKEQKQFEAAVETGHIYEMIDIWVPWWTPRYDTQNRKKIEDISEDNSVSKESNSNPVEAKEVKGQQIPSVKRNIPSLSSLMKQTKPNPNIQFSCIDVLFSYAYIMRLYNGCPDDTSYQAAESLMQLSAVLSQNAVFESIESVVYNSLSVVQNSKELYSEELSHCALLDVINLIQGHDVAQRANFTDCALSDLCRFLSRVREKLKLDIKKMKQKDTNLCRSLWLAKKKTEFLLAWIHSNTTVLQSLVLSIQVLHAEVTESCKQHKEETERLEKTWAGTKPPKKRPLITEM